MRRLFIINDSLSNKISFYIIAAFLVALPFDRFFSEWLLIVFCVHTAIHFRMEKLRELKNPSVWIAGSVFLLALLGLGYSDYRNQGLNIALQQIAILLFPVFLSVSGLHLASYKWQLLEIFGLTCVVTVLYLYFDAFRVIRYFHLPLASIVKKQFINQGFTKPIGLHATYFSMYVVLAVCIFIVLLLANNVRRSYIRVFCLIVLLIGLLQSSSRASLVAAATTIIFLVPLLLLRGKRRTVFFVVALVTVSFTMATVTQIGVFRKRLIDDLGNDLSEYRDPGDLTESRMARWKLEWQVILKSPFMGYGSGSEEDVLKGAYFQNKFYRSYLLGLNSHSQFLSFLLNQGLIGLLTYLYLFYYGGRIALLRKDFLLLAFLLLLFIVSLSENILDVSKGVLFFAFFLPFFLLSDSGSDFVKST